MKKFIILLLLIVNPLVILAEENVVTGEYGSYDNAINMVQEVMKSYYIRGPYLQYNYAKATYGKEAPEESTSQDNKYAVCAAYTYDVYAEAFGMYYSNTSKFPRYNYNIIEAAYDKYTKDSGNLDGNFLIYYESTVNTPSETNLVRNREIVKYVYNDTDTTSDSNDFKTLIENVRPGDLFVYTGHALIAYDVVDRDGDGALDDILILNSTSDEYIRTRIASTSNISFDLFQSSNGINGKNGFLDIEHEGTVQWLWLSQSKHFSKNGQLKCQEEECAVIRPFYEKNNKAMFNYAITPSQYSKGELRTQYPGLLIEKTINVGDNNSVYIGDELTYRIKITNKSNVAYNEVVYKSFKIKETLSDYVKYVSSSNSGKISGKNIIWEISKLNPNETIELTYTVKVIDEVANVNKKINSVGNFYSSSNEKVFISTGTIENKIIPKVTEQKESYISCYNKYKETYSGLELINEIYKCSTNNDFKFNEFKFDNIFTKVANGKVSSKINIKSDLDAINNNFKNMILNNYFSGLAKENSNYHLPSWSTTSSYRAKTINPTDFKNGDVLIYEIKNSKFTDEDGTYAYIYLDGKFIGINGNNSTSRNEFTYNYYENSNSVDLSTCKKYNYNEPGSECNYFYNLYAGYSKLSSYDEITKENILDFVNYQTLYDKDYYVILRPEIIIKEIANIDITLPSKLNYIQGDEELDLTGGALLIKYNDNSNETLNLTDENIKVTGFDNTKVGTNTITIAYAGQIKKFDIEVKDSIKDKEQNKVEETIENPETGIGKVIIIICIFLLSIIIVYGILYMHKKKFHKNKSL